MLRDASRVVKQQQHNSSTAAAQQRQQQRRRWRRRGSSSGQLPFGVSGWLLCCVSVAKRVCALSVCLYIWLSLVALESYTTTSNLAVTPQQHVIHQASKLPYEKYQVVIWSHFIKILKNVSGEYEGWVVETQLCKLRDT